MSGKAKKEKYLKIAVFLFPIVFIFFIILDKILFGPLNEDYVNFAVEDGPAEYGTSIFYFLSCIVSGIISYTLFKGKKKLFAFLFILLSFSFFFIASEEISWGQRILSIETPEYFEDNTQNEMNFHNMPIFEKYKRNFILLVGLVGFFLWVLFTHFDKLKKQPFTKFFIPQKFVMSYFISVIIFYGMDLFKQYIPQSKGFLLYIFRWPDHEVFELILSIGIFIFVLCKFIEIKKQKLISN